MIGDKIIITSKDRLKARSLLKHMLQLPDKSVITIGGGSGTKKTELAICLQEELLNHNRKSLLVSLDDYYKTHFRDRARIRQLKGLKIVGPQEIDWSLVKSIIRGFKNGETYLVLQQVNKYTGDYDLVISYGTKEVNYLIVEGLYANYLKKYRLSDLAIHLEGTPDQTFKFRKRRGKEDENSKFRKLVVKKEYEEVQKLKKYSDLTLRAGL